MLPIDKKWYRYLLITALLLGVIGAVAAITYNFITDLGIDFFFGDAGTDWWSGKWWWIPLTAFGGLLVAYIRKGWNVPKDVPGGVQTVGNAWVEPKSGIELVAISIVSVIFGASLGPSFGLILLGGAAGSWLVKRLKFAKNEEAKEEYALSGMAGALGGAFSAPIFASVLVSEVSPTKKRNYVSAFLPQLLAATVGFAIFFSVTGDALLGTFELPSYGYEPRYIVVGALLGVLAAVVLLAFVVITIMIDKIAAKINDPRARGVIGGAIVGLLAFALPLSAGSGVGQLSEVLDDSSSWGVTFLIAVLVAKMIAVSVSLASGFLGGNVFPIMFIGGITGVIVYLIFPDIPLALAVASMLAAVPGAYLNAPLSLILLGGGTVGLTILGMAPVAVALVVAHVTMTIIRQFISQRRAQAKA